MLEKDVKIGDRVVPHSKTACGSNNLSESNAWNHHGGKEQGFLYVSVRCYPHGEFTLSVEQYNSGDFFNASDFEPYIEPAKDNDFQAMFVNGNKTIVYLAGKRKGVSTCSPSDTFDPVKGVALAYMRALGQTVDDIRIEINPAKTEDTAQESKPTEDKPLTFEVGEMVKFREDLIDGKRYDGITYFDKMKNDLPKTFALPKFNAVRDCRLNGWVFPLCVLEKVPQPTNLEVIINGKEWMPKP